MALSLSQLRKEIGDYIAAHPDHWDEIIDIARNSGPPTEPLPKGTLVFKSATKWYAELQKLGRGRLVLSSDDSSRRRLGFAVSKDSREDWDAYKKIGLNDYK